MWNALKNPKDPAFEDQKVQFLTNVKGYVDGLAVSFEPSVKPIVFAMRPDRRFSDPDYLKRFTGEYDLAGRSLTVRLNGSALMLDSQGQPSAALIPDRNDAFKVKGQSEQLVAIRKRARPARERDCSRDRRRRVHGEAKGQVAGRLRTC